MKQILKKLNWLGAAQLVIAVVLALSPLVMQPATVQGQPAQPFIQNLERSCENTGVRCDSDFDLAKLFQTIINYALGIAFFVAVIYLIYGGFLYITSAGNEESATKGKNAVVYSLIGIVIIVLSFVIVSVVYRFVATNNGGGTIN